MSEANETVQETAVESQPAAVGAPDGAPGLSLQDLSTALQIITVVQARGAIKAEEMAVVGALYNKLVAFLKAAGVAPEGVAPEGEPVEDGEKDGE